MTRFSLLKFALHDMNELINCFNKTMNEDIQEKRNLFEPIRTKYNAKKAPDLFNNSAKILSVSKLIQ
jgi:hypothetical protein